MAGLGTWFALIMLVAAFLLWRGRLYSARWALWALLLQFSAALHRQHRRLDDRRTGRQPWLIYGLMRTSEGYSNTVSASNGLFTLLASWAIIYCWACCFTVLIYREISNGRS